MSKFLLALTLVLSLAQGARVSQLTDAHFPDRHYNGRKHTKDKRLFKAYPSQEMIIDLEAHSVLSADVLVNGRKVPVRFKWEVEPAAPLRVNITDYLKDGDNTFSIQNIIPRVAFINAFVPFPVLKYGDAKSVGISPELLKKVDELIVKEVGEGFPGATLVVAKNGKIIKETAYGYARKYKDDGKPMESYQKMRVDTMFDLASNTKIFATLFGIMKLQSDGKLRYTDTLNKYMPEYKGVLPEGYDKTKIRIFDILTHTAGYVEPYRFYDDHGNIYSRDKDTTKKLICERIPVPGDKGGIPRYNDVNYILAGLLIEKISNLELHEYCKRFFYNPLKLLRTTFAPLKRHYGKADTAATEITGNTKGGKVEFKDVRKTVIQGEVEDENSFYSMNETAGHAGLFSTAKELAILGQVLLNHGGYGWNKFWSCLLYTSPSPRD
eukprot:TRINITY_DN1715_c0_g1_i6.p1 TRINITY_DN1715_c0_g1~~TRINITY_DN1715_c0_g1_i6.p1  ORF type:complete len:437 (-),score=126.25 TRINITY_DN1715_c0_g1_i6:53-1363(-)